MTTRGAAEDERLSALATYDVIGLPADDPVIADLTAVCELAATVIGASSAVVNLVDDRVQHEIAAYGTDRTAYPRDQALCCPMLTDGTDLCVADASAHPQLASSPLVDGRLAQIRFVSTTVLRTPAGHAIGTLCVYDHRPRQISEHQRRAVAILAHQVVDVLELRLRRRQLERSHAELSRSQDRLASFAEQISHDLKAPITAILGFTELLEDLDNVSDDASASAYVGRCTSAARRMLTMIDDLLAFARVGGTLQVRPVALDTLMPEILDDLSTASAGAAVNWSGPDVLGDPTQLRALLQNLVGNSLTYRSAEPCEVQVISEQVGQSMVLRIIDNGSGIPAGSREDVVRPLFRLRKEITGAGLGLAICARIVDAHGGSLRLDETPGGGTTATVVLPL